MLHKSDYVSDGIPVINPVNMIDARIAPSSKMMISEDTRHRLSKYVLRIGDIVVARRGELGRCALVTEGEDGWLCGTGSCFIRLSKQLDERFFVMLFGSSRFRSLLEDASVGTTMSNLNHGILNNLPIPVPSLPEQRRVVGILEEAFDAIATAKAHAEKNLRNARALFESHLNAVLRSKNWKWTTLGALCDGVEYGSSAKSKKQGKVPVIRMGNVQGGRLDWNDLVYTDDKVEIEKYLLKHNDVLFNRTNSPELVGKTAVYKSEMPSIFAGYLIRIHRKEELLDADFLNYFLNSQIAFDYGKTVVISSVNQANINGTKLKGYPIPAPPLPEQRAIVENLDEIANDTQRLGSIYQRKLTALDELKRSLLHQAFNGELTTSTCEIPLSASEG